MHDRVDIAELFGRLVSLFEQDLEGVAFPCLDIDVLREAATQHAESVIALAEAEEALVSARDRLARQREELTALHQRALGYAGVYAGDDADLVAKLGGLQQKRRAGKRASQSRAAQSRAAKSRSSSKSKAAPTAVPDGSPKRATAPSLEAEVAVAKAS